MLKNIVFPELNVIETYFLSFINGSFVDQVVESHSQGLELDWGFFIHHLNVCILVFNFFESGKLLNDEIYRLNFKLTLELCQSFLKFTKNYMF